MQIRNKLTLQFIMIAAGILLAALFFIYFQFKKNLENEFYSNLRSKALMTAEMVVGKLAGELRLENDSQGPLSGSYTENISIYALSGDRIYSFNPVPGHIPPATLGKIRKAEEYRFCHGEFDAIGILYANRAGKRFLVVAEAVFDPVHLRNLSRILAGVFIISIALVAAGGWFFARQALAPVSHIMNQVDALLPADMSQRLETFDRQDELSRLVVTFNKLLDRIQHAFKLQKMFLSNISHELKNPLNVIISQIEIALGKERPNEAYKQVLSSVLSDVKDLNEMADKLMQMAKINTDGSVVQFQLLRIDEVIWQTKNALLKSHPEYKIHFEVANLPEQEEKLCVRANEQLLKTALANLMDNSCKFSPCQSVRIRLSFAPENNIVVEIEDRGPGIRTEELPMVFDAFYRSPATASVKGSGIGLSLVNDILKLHQTGLGVDSTPGGGTTFTLRFPPVSAGREPVNIL
ncbi:MAG: HAMP domain-containing histidine kinase [Phaeodactylibacter sp.]|nr:HAMP domain-containing histidine kinase [Phaeodactylibacter sp.]